MSGSPSSTSIARVRTSCAFQPIVLKASVTPTPVSPLVVELSVRASIWEVLRASTVTAPVVVRLPFRT